MGKSDLDQQVNLKQTLKEQEVEEDKRYHQNSMTELERWKQMEHVRDQEKKTKNTREKSDRDEQLVFERKLKNDEVKKKKDEEANLVEKIVNEMEAEQRKFEKKKDD